MRDLPPLVCQLTQLYDAWIVGSAAVPCVNLATVRDFDVLVPFARWQMAATLVPRDAVPNTFAGWKCKSDDCTVDVWPGDLAWLMTGTNAKWAWHPRTGTRLMATR